jgi:ATP-dependent RNA helicase RhlE
MRPQYNRLRPNNSDSTNRNNPQSKSNESSPRAVNPKFAKNYEGSSGSIGGGSINKNKPYRGGAEAFSKDQGRLSLRKNDGYVQAQRSARPIVERGPRPVRVQKYMDVDYNILVKKAVPQAIEDYAPTKNFKEHGLNVKIIESLDLKGYTQPTPIQDQAIPHIMESRDILGIANTGTGKTAAFLLPLIHQVLENPYKRILILAPTRELVTQIFDELQTFIGKSDIRSVTIVGGENIDRQIKALKKPMNFIISTTGRGLDLIEKKCIAIREIDTIVLDEMDQMLDMGFIKDIQKVLKLAVAVRHLLFFSATTTPEIKKLAMSMLTNPVSVSVVRGQTADNVNQDVIEIREGDNKIEKLCELLALAEVEKSIVFENTKHGASRIEKELNKRGFKSLAIHGNKTQGQRTRALDAFKASEIDILIATNVAARGLDIPLVSHVINFSLPQSKEDYIHRIGRTGRAGEVGQAWTFVPIDEINMAKQNPPVKMNKKARARESTK